MCDAFSDDGLTPKLRVQVALITTKVLDIVVKGKVLLKLLQEICLASRKRYLSDDLKHVPEVEGRVKCDPSKFCVQKQPRADDMLSEELVWYSLIDMHLEIQPSLLK